MHCVLAPRHACHCLYALGQKFPTVGLVALPDSTSGGLSKRLQSSTPHVRGKHDQAQPLWLPCSVDCC